MLSTYSWPGNIRELKNVIRQSSLMSEVSPIDLMDLPPSIRTGSICADFKLEIDNAELKNESVRKSEPKEIHPQRETISPSITADEKRDLPCELNGHTKDKEAPISIISLREAEKNMIKQALAFTGGNLTRTASLLEISRSALYRRLDKLQISRNQY